MLKSANKPFLGWRVLDPGICVVDNHCTRDCRNQTNVSESECPEGEHPDKRPAWKRRRRHGRALEAAMGAPETNPAR